jgi:hypothetical protein
MNAPKRIPPSYPLRYVLQRHHFLCSGCGATAEFSIMLTCRRTGAHNKGWSRTDARETVYDLPCDQTDTSFVTPRCERCFASLPKEAVPELPRPLALVGLYKPEEADRIMARRRADNDKIVVRRIKRPPPDDITEAELKELGLL